MSGRTSGAYPRPNPFEQGSSHLNKGLVTWHTQPLGMLGNTKDEERALMDGGSCCQKETAKSLGLAALELSKHYLEVSMVSYRLLSSTFQM